MTTGIQPDRPPLRIVFVTTTLSSGGAEMMLLKLCSGFDRRRIEPSVVCLADANVVGPRLESLGVAVHALGMRPSRPTLAGFLQLRRLVAALDPHVVQGWMYHGNLAAWVARSAQPLVWGIRQSLYALASERPMTRWVIRANAWLSGKVAAIVYNSATSEGQHAKFGFDTSHARVIPNGFDTETWVPDEQARKRVRQELRLDDDALLIGLIGRYHPMKNHDVFFAAAAELASRAPHVHFVLAGAQVSESNAALATQIERLRLRGRVHLLGERSDVPQLTAALDVACSTSGWGEGFANVVGEAMSCGVPCVVTDIGDSAHIVADTGVIVPPRDPAALARAWGRLIDLGRGGREALGRRARQRIVENFSLRTIVKQYEDLYDRLIQRPGT